MILALLAFSFAGMALVNYVDAPYSQFWLMAAFAAFLVCLASCLLSLFVRGARRFLLIGYAAIECVAVILYAATIDPANYPQTRVIIFGVFNDIITGYEILLLMAGLWYDGSALLHRLYFFRTSAKSANQHTLYSAKGQ